MQKSIKTALFIVVTALATRLAGAEERFPSLTVGATTFTNVVVLSQSETHLFIRHAGGVESIKLQDLSPDLQKRFGYDPAKAAEALNALRTTDPVAGISGRTPAAANASERDWTNKTALKLPHGFVLKEFSMGKKGKLQLFVPEAWVASSSGNSADGSGLAISFEPKYGNDFLVILRAISASDPLMKMGVQNTVTMVRNHALATAADNSLNLESLNGAETDGYYFSMTDKTLDNQEPKPGTYRFRTMGLVKMDDFALNFTILRFYQQGSELFSSLEMLKTAHLQKDDSSTK